MAISDNDLYLLNNRAGSIAARVQLGTLIRDAETGAPADASITAAKLAADSVITAKILNANVTLAKLAAGITPSHVVKYAGKFTTVGGDTAEAIAVPGVLATDVVHVTVQDGTESVVSAKAGVDVIDVVLSDDPSTTHILCYSVLRAAA